MNIAINGASGFMGKHLIKHLTERGYRIVSPRRPMFREGASGHLTQTLSHCDIVIDLAGTPISKRRTPKYKKEFYDSRIKVTHRTIRVMDAVETKSRLMISASIVGYHPEDGTFDEYTNTRGGGFLAELCYTQEKGVRRCPSQTRLTITRFGIVLSSDGGTMEQMLRPLRITRIASMIAPGTQPFPWIGIQDLCCTMEFIINHEVLSGVSNLVIPQQVSQYAFTRAMTARYHAWMKVMIPRWFFRMQYGETAPFLMSGWNVRPTRLLEVNFRFDKPTIEAFFEGTDYSMVDELDLQRYTGTWCEIARFDHYFERRLSEVTTTYTLLLDGTIRVENRGCKRKKPYDVCKTTKGRVKVLDSSRPDELKVSFFLSLYLGYYVLEPDQEEHNYMLISGSPDEYLRISSYTPILPEEVKKKLLNATIRRGYDVDKLIWVEQGERNFK